MNARLDITAAVLATGGTGEGEFVTGVIVIVVILTIIFLGAKKKQAAKDAEFSRTLRAAEIQTEIAKYHRNHALGESAPASKPQIGSEIIRANAVLLENAPAQTTSQDKFDSVQALQSALAVHEALADWTPMLFAALEKAGINKEDATLQMAALFTKMEQASKGYFPTIISLVMASTLRSYVQYLTTEEGNLNCITPELALAIIGPLFKLEDGLDAVLQEAGWKTEEIASQFSELSKKITTAANGSKPGVAPLSFAFTVDNYVKHLVTGTMKAPS